MKQKFFYVFFAFCLCLGTANLSSCDNEDDDNEVEAETEKPQASYKFIYDGVCFRCDYYNDDHREATVIEWEDVVHGLYVNEYQQENLVVPESFKYAVSTYTVTGIDMHAFRDSECKTITLPATIKTIGLQAFTNAHLLGALYLHIQDPDKVVGKEWNGLDPFSPGKYERMKLFVPQGTLQKYKRHKMFGKFKHIEEDANL